MTIWTDPKKLRPSMIISWIQIAETTPLFVISTPITFKIFGHVGQISKNKQWMCRPKLNDQTLPITDLPDLMIFSFTLTVLAKNKQIKNTESTKCSA